MKLCHKQDAGFRMKGWLVLLTVLVPTNVFVLALMDWLCLMALFLEGPTLNTVALRCGWKPGGMLSSQPIPVSRKTCQAVYKTFFFFINRNVMLFFLTKHS